MLTKLQWKCKPQLGSDLSTQLVDIAEHLSLLNHFALQGEVVETKSADLGQELAPTIRV